MLPPSPTEEESRAGTRDWPHAPPHRLGASGVYFVTARTLHQFPHFKTSERLDFVRDRLFELVEKYGWRLEAWAILSNHYHFVGHSPIGAESADSLGKLLKHLHADITRHVNRLDGAEGRKTWHNFRESHLTFQSSYLARLNYTHQNPVHHKLVRRAEDYAWCSARDFEKACTPAWVKTIRSFQYEQISREDGE
jgi:putative transposase